MDIQHHGRIWDSLRPKRDVYTSTIKNDAPYIVVLEHGWSMQAPNGFVDVHLDDAVNILDRELGEATGQIFLGEDAHREVEQAVDRAADAILSLLFRPDTPIDTGFARSRWEVESANGTFHDSGSLFGG